MTRQSRVTAGLALAALGLGCSGSALAEETGWYFGLSGGLTTSGESKSDITNKIVGDIATGLADADLILTAATVNADLDDSDNGWGVHIGYRFNRYVAAEFGYVDLGKFVYTNTMALTVDDGPGGAAPQVFNAATDQRLEANGAFASVIGMYPIGDSFDVHVRGGVLFSDVRNRARSTVENDPDTFSSVEGKDSKEELFGGIGATWNINPSYSVRVEYQKFLDLGDTRTGERDIDLLNVSLLFR
jgi:hypothetical protein